MLKNKIAKNKPIILAAALMRLRKLFDFGLKSVP